MIYRRAMQWGGGFAIGVVVSHFVHDAMTGLAMVFLLGTLWFVVLERIS